MTAHCVNLSNSPLPKTLLEFAMMNCEAVRRARVKIRRNAMRRCAREWRRARRLENWEAAFLLLTMAIHWREQAAWLAQGGEL